MDTNDLKAGTQVTTPDGRVGTIFHVEVQVHDHDTKTTRVVDPGSLTPVEGPRLEDGRWTVEEVARG